MTLIDSLHTLWAKLDAIQRKTRSKPIRALAEEGKQAVVDMKNTLGVS